MLKLDVNKLKLTFSLWVRWIQTQVKTTTEPKQAKLQLTVTNISFAEWQ